MRFSILAFILGTSGLALAASSSNFKPLETFDIYAAPVVGVSTGEYKAGSVEHGNLLNLHYSGRVGFKLGPVLLGGEFGSVKATRSQPKTTLSTANKVKYAEGDSGDITMVGVNLGLAFDRVTFWTTYYPASTLDIKYNDAGTKYNNSYDGKSYSVGFDVRVWERLYIGAIAFQSEFSKYSTNHTSGTVDNAALSPKLKFATYGLTVSYLFPLSDLKKFSWGSGGK